jgi:diaminobutyrate-2-oxoglutarate transaminase
LDYLVKEDVSKHVKTVGGHMKRALEDLCKTHNATHSYEPLFAEVRGEGLMLAVEMADAETAITLHGACFKQGLLLQKGGREGKVLRFLPPLVVSQDEIDLEILPRFERAVLEVHQQLQA